LRPVFLQTSVSNKRQSIIYAGDSEARVLINAVDVYRKFYGAQSLVLRHIEIVRSRITGIHQNTQKLTGNTKNGQILC